MRHWDALTLYTQHAFLAIDNNAAERALRAIAVGRSNWLFVGSATGGRTAAILFSVTSTCRRLGCDPFTYLRDVFDRLAQAELPAAELPAAELPAAELPAAELDRMLPDRWTPPSAESAISS